MFKSFDMDFDGKVCLKDLEKALINLVKVNHKEITDVRLQRLMHLLSFHKKDYLLLADFERLINKEIKADTFGTTGVSKKT